MKKLLLTVAFIIIVIALTACSSSEHKHDYVVESEIPATCTENGSLTYKCNNCEKTYTKTLAAGHDWQAGDCITPKTCRKCNTTNGEAPGHTYENNVCIRCKEELSLNIIIPTASPEAPLEITNLKDNGDIRSKFEITSVEYKLAATSSDDITLTVILEGKKTSDAIYGDKRSSVGKIAFKICDEEGAVIFSNVKDTMMLCEGESFKNLKISLSGFNSEQKYELVFLPECYW